MNEYFKSLEENCIMGTIPINMNSFVKQVLPDYELKFMVKKGEKSCAFYDKKKIYLNLWSEKWEELNIPIWECESYFQYTVLTLLHEVGHVIKGHTGGGVMDGFSEIWDHLRSEKEGEAWDYAFKYRRSNKNEFEKMVTEYEKWAEQEIPKLSGRKNPFDCKFLNEISYRPSYRKITVPQDIIERFS